MGDVNFNEDMRNNLTRYLEKLQYVQVVKKATHLEGNLIDHVYIPKEIGEEEFTIEHHGVYYSDHDAIIVQRIDDNKE